MNSVDSARGRRTATAWPVENKALINTLGLYHSSRIFASENARFIVNGAHHVVGDSSSGIKDLGRGDARKGRAHATDSNGRTVDHESSDGLRRALRLRYALLRDPTAVSATRIIGLLIALV